MVLAAIDDEVPFRVARQRWVIAEIGEELLFSGDETFEQIHFFLPMAGRTFKLVQATHPRRNASMLVVNLPVEQRLRVTPSFVTFNGHAISPAHGMSALSQNRFAVSQGPARAAATRKAIPGKRVSVR